MKKILSMAFLAVFCLTTNAQEEASEAQSNDGCKISVNIGSTSGDSVSRDFYSRNVGFNFTYLFNFTDDLQFGVVTGYKRIFENDSSDTFNHDGDTAYISFGGEVRLYTDNDKFYFGGDTGYAVGPEDGGFYYRPKLGLVVSKHSGIYVSYSEVNDKDIYSSVNFGYEYSF